MPTHFHAHIHIHVDMHLNSCVHPQLHDHVELHVRLHLHRHFFALTRNLHLHPHLHHHFVHLRLCRSCTGLYVRTHIDKQQQSTICIYTNPHLHLDILLPLHLQKPFHVHIRAHLIVQPDLHLHLEPPTPTFTTLFAFPSPGTDQVVRHLIEF